MLKQVQESGEPLTVTLRGRPIARVEPVLEKKKEIRLGALKGSIEIRGDIIRSDMEKDWLVPGSCCSTRTSGSGARRRSSGWAAGRKRA